ncbi:hypothetical protein [Achromobacter ruhlandii]|uniref:hypothetical protein n=1 Tax=Achromobacter ruhlandii TaxID=72557 RepID=UPI0012E71683|nr:hypothetical protein [Achromobacter ruhlandii]
MNRNVDRAAKTGGRAWQAVLRGRREKAGGKEQAASGKRQAAGLPAQGRGMGNFRHSLFFPYIWDLILYFEIFQALI